MGTINRVPSDVSHREPPTPPRTDEHRGAANASAEIPDQNQEMQAGNVTAPQKASREVKTPAVDIRQEEPHPVRRRRLRLDKHA
jgi:hypothetical protein